MAAPCCPSRCLVSLQFGLETMFLGARKTPGTLYSLVPLLRCALGLQDRLPSPACLLRRCSPRVYLVEPCGFPSWSSYWRFTLRHVSEGFLGVWVCPWPFVPVQSLWPLTLGGLPRASCFGGQTF